MELDTRQSVADVQLAAPGDEAVVPAEGQTTILQPGKSRGADWVFIGSEGLRSGWSVLIFTGLMVLFILTLGSAESMILENMLHLKTEQMTFLSGLIQEAILFLSMLGAGMAIARIEHRRILDYNLSGSRGLAHFFEGLAAGFLALSALVGGLAWGGWLKFGPAALSGGAIVQFALVWALVFLLVAFFEEGSMRCYLQFTLTRGINFWWALGAEAAICLDLLLRARGNGVWGVYAAALLGLLPCLALHLRKTPGERFWQAAWVTSTLFGFIHTHNNGENWIGIFAAAAIGFAFCVSIWVTGSAWWAIGCHAAWDWAETFFYGTADSGIPAKGHYLTTTPAGSALWSGGADGPEGSLLVLPVILLLLVALLAFYGGKRAVAAPAPVAEPVAG